MRSEDLPVPNAMLGSKVKLARPRISELAQGALLIFKLKAHHYLGKASLSSIWKETDAENRATLANEQ